MSEVLHGGADSIAGGSVGELPFLLERHFYDAGLHVEPVGRDRTRPPWVPPHDWVGFRNDVPLAAGDLAVEFVRFRYRERAVTWIGLFRRAVDAVYGDRQNHEGLGAWLLDQDVLHGKALLQSLHALTERIGAEGVRACDPSADRLLQEFLPQFVVPHLELRTPMGGWSLARGQVTETAIFEATAHDRAAAWSLAAKQLLRASVLAGPSPTHSRCVILIRTADPGGDDGLDKVPGGLATEIVKALPQALAAASDAQRDAAREAQALAERLHSAQVELERERDCGRQLAEQVAVLQREVAGLQEQLEDSDPERIWASVRAKLHDISGQVERTENSVLTTRREILDRLKSPATHAARPHDWSVADSSDPVRRPYAGAGQQATSKRTRERTLYYGVAATLVLLILVLGYFTYARLAGPSPAAPAEVGRQPAEDGLL